jgi:hypothetical protein
VNRQQTRSPAGDSPDKGCSPAVAHETHSECWRLFRRRWPRIRRLGLATMFMRPFVAPTIAAFWRRWNPAAHLFLLACVYRPLRRRGAPRSLAMLAAFLVVGCGASALLAVLCLDPDWLYGPRALFAPLLFTLFGLATLGSQRVERSERSVLPWQLPQWGLAVKNLTSLLLCFALSWLPFRSFSLKTAPAEPHVRVSLDVSAAEGFLRFWHALDQGQPWSDGAIYQLVSSAPYQTLLAHHGALDDSVTAEAVSHLFIALRDGEVYGGESPRLTRMYLTYQWAHGELATLEKRLAELDDEDRVQQAAEKAGVALPPEARLECTVYVLADGYSPAYATDDAIVLDLLQVAPPGRVGDWLAHEMHHIGAASLLPEPCPDPSAGVALDVMAGLIQEGTATRWVDDWRAFPAERDYEQVAGFLSDVLEGRLSRSEARARLTELLGDDKRGPLYRVGNGVIVTLSAAHGDDWVRARLSDPVGLLREAHRTGGWPSLQETLTLLDKSRSACPQWFQRRR